MPKIGFITKHNPEDKDAWSGLIFSMHKKIKEHFDVQCLMVKEGSYSNIVSRAITKYYKTFRHKNVAREKLKIVSESFGRHIERELKKFKDIDILFAPAGSEHIAYLDTRTPIILLGDATFKIVNNYYPYFSNLPNFNLRDGNEIERLAFIKASRIILSSDWAKSSAILDYGTPQKKISVLEFGANLAAPKKIIKPTTKKEVKLLFVGKEWGRKGGDIAVQVTRYLNNKYKIPTLLRIVGCYPEVTPDNFIEVIGYLNKNNKADHNKISELFLESDLFLLPTKAECSAVVFSEAAGFGLPVITYDTGGNGNYVMDGVNGYRLPLDSRAEEFADVIARLCSENRISQFSISARKIYEDRLNWEIWGMKFKKLVEELLENGTSG